MSTPIKFKLKAWCRKNEVDVLWDVCKDCHHSGKVDEINGVIECGYEVGDNHERN